MKFFYVLLCIICMSLTSFASDGHVEGNGGDTYSLKFINIARDVYGYILASNNKFPEFKADHLLDSIYSTTVSTKDQCFIGDREVDAINYPELNKIELSRTRWMNLGNNRNKKMSLVLHEYLGIMRISDTAYQISSRLIDIICDIASVPKDITLYHRLLSNNGVGSPNYTYDFFYMTPQYGYGLSLGFGNDWGENKINGTQVVDELTRIIDVGDMSCKEMKNSYEKDGSQTSEQAKMLN